ncbi:adenylyltransferase/sulfurtransferase MoeZ, partial [Nocardia elegans]|uniref:rhodanese-like domain-containing protein n=1 Tax=Nocardia elegans TaxID=300029 RepID=UPI00226BC6FA
MVYDALDMTYRTIKLRRDPDRQPITELIDYEAFCGVVSEEGQAAAAGSTITARELKELLDAGKEIERIDVREPVEWDIVHIEGAKLIPKDRILSGEALSELPQNRPIVLHCKTGIRSAEALAVLKNAGFTDATHVQGGIVAWANQIDPSLPVY